MNADTKNNEDKKQIKSVEETWQTADDEEILMVSRKLMERNTYIYEELAK